jgi:hypothetical protein
LQEVVIFLIGPDSIVRTFYGYISYATGKLAPAQNLANRVVLLSFNRADDGGKGRIFYTLLPIMVSDSAWSKSETIEFRDRQALNQVV